MRSDEHSLPPLRNLLNASGRAVVVQNFLHQTFRPESLALSGLDKVFQDIGQMLPIHDVFEPDEAEFRFAAAGGIRNHADRTGGSDRRHVGISDPLAAALM